MMKIKWAPLKIALMTKVRMGFIWQWVITAVLLGSFAELAMAVTLHVASNGTDRAGGTADKPLSLKGAIQRAAQMIESQGLPDQGITIMLHGGEYAVTQREVLGKLFKGSEDKPIVIRSAPGETVRFDGSRKIPLKGFSKVTDPRERARLARSAQDKIWARTITDPILLKKLRSAVVLNLSIDDDVYLPSCFPNSGYAELAYQYSVGEISPPAVPQNPPEGAAGRAGQAPWRVPGKPNGWKGSLQEPCGAQVGIGKRADEMAGSWSQWANEINHNNSRNVLTGFISADWLLESHPIFGVNAEARTIHLSRATAYGWHGSKHQHKHFKVYGLLCELDQPGEWHFDTRTSRFYVYPPKPFDQIKQIGFPYASGFIALNDTEYVSIQGLAVQNVGAGTVFEINGGQHNLIGGCQVRNCTAKGIDLRRGSYNGAVGCDLVDLDWHVGLSGGERGPDKIIPGHNYVKNCHIYQVKFNHRKIGIGMSGVGNVFANNLVHNSIGQAMIIYGNDQLIERNEFFNIGYDEGDGGAMYSGADLAGYGNTYRHNFIHHLIHVPGKVARAGIHLDDLQAGAILEGNIFFKSAEKGIFMNAGAGHVIRNNVLLEGSLGIYNVAAGSQKTYERQLDIDSDPHHDLKGNKEDYVGRTVKVVGPNGWNHQPWLTKYPRFALVMNDKGINGRLWPIRCLLEGNMYYGNGRGDHAVWSRFSPESQAKSVIVDEKVISPDWFVNYDQMDFRFKKQDRNMPVIPFDEIGLYLGSYRTEMPAKSYYRMAIREFFRDVKSMPGTTRQINTGRIVEQAPKITASSPKESNL